MRAGLLDRTFVPTAGSLETEVTQPTHVLEESADGLIGLYAVEISQAFQG